MANRIVEGVCALCRKPRRLLNSHILPQFLWKHSGVIGGGNKYDLISATDSKTSRFNQQDGPKEHLCCRECEGSMSRWEDAAKRVWFNENSPFRHPAPHHAGYMIDNLPYREMKLFFMSILWKMGLSKNPHYCAVELGSDEHRLRRLLLAGTPGEPWRHGCLVSILKHRGALLGDYFSQPAELATDLESGHKLFCMVAAGVLLVFVVGTKRFANPFGEQYVPMRGPWDVRVREISQYAALWLEFQAWAKLNGFEI